MLGPRPVHPRVTQGEQLGPNYRDECRGVRSVTALAATTSPAWPAPSRPNPAAGWRSVAARALAELPNDVLLSRVAERLYWGARCVARAEDTARVVAEHTHLLVDLPTSVPLTWEPLLAVSGTRSQFDRRYPAPTSVTSSRSCSPSATTRRTNWRLSVPMGRRSAARCVRFGDPWSTPPIWRTSARMAYRADARPIARGRWRSTPPNWRLSALLRCRSAARSEYTSSADRVKASRPPRRRWGRHSTLRVAGQPGQGSGSIPASRGARS
jgi:A predicted alpha-helical domain with a conserved ER motif.